MEHPQAGARLHAEALSRDEIPLALAAEPADRQRTHRSCVQDTGIAKEEAVGHELAAQGLPGDSDAPGADRK